MPLPFPAPLSAAMTPKEIRRKLEEQAHDSDEDTGDLSSYNFAFRHGLPLAAGAAATSAAGPVGGLLGWAGMRQYMRSREQEQSPLSAAKSVFTPPAANSPYQNDLGLGWVSSLPFQQVPRPTLSTQPIPAGSRDITPGAVPGALTGSRITAQLSRPIGKPEFSLQRGNVPQINPTVTQPIPNPNFADAPVSTNLYSIMESPNYAQKYIRDQGRLPMYDTTSAGEATRNPGQLSDQEFDRLMEGVKSGSEPIKPSEYSGNKPASNEPSRPRFISLAKKPVDEVAERAANAQRALMNPEREIPDSNPTESLSGMEPSNVERPNMSPFIPAIKDPMGQTYTGHSHLGALEKMPEPFQGRWSDDPSFTEGFIGPDGRFLTRQEALNEARKFFGPGRLSDLYGEGTAGHLITEDLPKEKK